VHIKAVSTSDLQYSTSSLCCNQQCSSIWLTSGSSLPLHAFTARRTAQVIRIGNASCPGFTGDRGASDTTTLPRTWDWETWESDSRRLETLKLLDSKVRDSDRFGFPLGL
jgi:hypothetical protein